MASKPSFFLRKEFTDYKKAHKRIQELGGHTLKNINIYVNLLAKAMTVAKEEYNDIGWDKINGRYKWHTIPDLAPKNYTDDDVYEFIHGKKKEEQGELF